MLELTVLSLCTLLLWAEGGTGCAGGGRNGTTYGFVRDVSSYAAGNTRRVFGGAAAALADHPAACALLDRYFGARCSAAVLAPHWALTAAHCISPVISYIKYNTLNPASDQGDIAAIHYLYRHPEYRVLQEDQGNGMDVTLLHHDVGLVRSRDRIQLHAALPRDPLASLRRYDTMNLINEEVQVLGFGRTEKKVQGEVLCGARLVLVRCGRAAWYHVVCGAAAGGVCAGDSGGPLLFGGAQVAVTSMGPRECALGPPPADALSVFTALRPYVDVLNATIADTDAALRMRMISRAPPAAVLVIWSCALPLYALVPSDV